MSWEVRVVPGRYADSVRLMRVAAAARTREGVDGCELIMGTPANLDALAAVGPTVEAGPSDLVIAVLADDPGVRTATLDAADREVAAGEAPAPGAGGDEIPPPRSLPAALPAVPGANVALVSVPGEYATLEAHRALTAGLHVFLFSDHVSVPDEVALKRRGAERGLLVMGPGCGTAMLGGVGLGFANVVRTGPVGVVAAAGTGAQEAACLLEAAGTGVSQIIGVGGRDLSADVGGIMFRQGMRMLADDPATDTLLLVSKPPSPEVVATLGAEVPDGVRVVAAFVGWPGGDAPFEVHATLEAAVWAVAGGDPPPDPEPTDDERRRAGGGRLVGLYSGGTLAYEALTILGPRLGAVGGNLSPAGTPEDGHVVLDLGEEEYTQGRPHPMVDPTVRLGLMDDAADAGAGGCVLLDVVLGHGSHDDPAGALVPAIRRLVPRWAVVAHVCGAEGDPQGLDRQIRTLEEAGARVLATNAAAARFAARLVTGA